MIGEIIATLLRSAHSTHNQLIPFLPTNIITQRGEDAIETVPDAERDRRLSCWMRD